jgi:hypothetical protein
LQIGLGVDERRIDVSVAEKIRDGFQGLSVLEKPHGESVPEDMRALAGIVNARLAQAPVHHGRN